jgi:hypothetical protein
MAIAEAGLTPAVEDFINKVIRNRILLGYQLMTIFAFPRATIAIFYLFEYHNFFPSIKFSKSNRAINLSFDTSNATCSNATCPRRFHNRKH